MANRLEKHVVIKKKLTCKTGLHIGGSKDDMEIGGMDNPIIRDPMTKLPYIPGSSIKGKLRSLLEARHCAGKLDDRGNPCGCGREDCPVCKLFGPHFNQRHNLGPTRLIVRDAFLTEESKAELKDKIEAGSLFAEIKHEVMIDRNKGTASRAGPRPVERVPAGAEFQLELVLRVFEADDEQKMLGTIEEGFDLLQMDYLGGSGSRGYGKVEIENNKAD